jgi:type IV pilus assembly protein PilV
MKYPKISQKVQKGVVLLESLIALLLFSMGILALVGLQTLMVRNTTDSKFRTDAAFIAKQRIGELWASGASSCAGSCDAFLEAAPGTDISTLLPNGRRIVTQPAQGQFRVVITWNLPGESTHNYTTTASISGG